MKNQIHIQSEAGRDAIAVRAYHLWEQAGRPVGRDREHWLQAEAELNTANQRAIVKIVSADANAISKRVHAVASRRPQNHITRPTGRMTDSGFMEGARKERTPKATQSHL